MGRGHQLSSRRCSRSQHSPSSISRLSLQAPLSRLSAACSSALRSALRALPGLTASPFCVHDPTPPYLSFFRRDMDTLSTCATYQEHIHSTYVTHRSQHIRHTGDQQDRTIRTTTAKEATKAKRARCRLRSTLSPSPHTGSSLSSLPWPLIRLVL